MRESRCCKCFVWRECCWLRVGSVRESRGVAGVVSGIQIVGQGDFQSGRESSHSCEAASGSAQDWKSARPFVEGWRLSGSRVCAWRGKSNAVDQSAIRTQFSVSSHAVRGGAGGGSSRACASACHDSNEGASPSCTVSSKAYLMHRASPEGISNATAASLTGRLR